MSPVDGGLSLLPRWFQKLGIGAWLVVGIVVVVVGLVWVLDKTSTIAEPLIVGGVVGAVGGGAVDWLQRHKWPRPLGAAVIILAVGALGLLVVGLVLGGISSQSSHIDASTSQAVDKVQKWAHDIGITSAADAAKDIKKAVPRIGTTLLKGVAGGIRGLTSLLVFLGFSAFITFFMLKDGPTMGRWIERHMGMPPATARIVTGNIVRALRKYFLGLTIVGAFNAGVVTVGALVLGVPLVGTIALVTFLASYVPILGAWTAGIFTFALALADKGTSTAFIMALIVFLANGPLQQIVQPIAYGATLQLNPLVVFTVTIAAGSLFGMVGLVLAAPLVSAAVRINDDLAELEGGPAVTGPGSLPSEQRTPAPSESPGSSAPPAP
jgi:putative heme transporter